MDITKKERDCLVAIGSIDSKFQPRLIDIAKSMKVSAPTAYNLVKRLCKKGLIEDYKGSIAMTEKGRKMHKDIIMAHRCIEVLLSKAGIDKDCACKDAQKIDYVIGTKEARKLLYYIGNPKSCPHGKPIVIA
ncbi:MAG: metal-dependent transcriptional regulator [Candidatus Micrarchaeia archaeon]